ncbi:hypothetical protein WICPIJ_007725 [Wickerhamomyces pijperi]|uniref:Ribosome-associated complex subunit SSZ1 n=1 Tax=Wickerhamomyces pijperi TaxID=599730 RepID=A0A9P8PZQ2_WICPI|nr:hypothetical protein WICPIJ_007725 [Wickerhamomyces pijperi]
MTVIGISFGNTTSSIAHLAKDGIEVIANPDGERAIPSSLSYIAEDEYHGGQSLAHLVRNPNNVIINFRDSIGQSFDKLDLTLTDRAAKTTQLESGDIGFKIQTSEGESKQISVNEATVRHLENLKHAAVDYLGQQITGVVIAIPTDFTASQKEQLVAASEKAGLQVLQLISEPSAALLAHASIDDKLAEDKTYVVADFGGVRSDAAVISVRGGILTVLATAHDFSLNGDNLDAALADHIAAEFKKKYQTNAKSNPRSIAKLKEASVLARKTLSNVSSATISIEALADGIDFHSSINRLRFEVTCRSVLSQFPAFVESVVKKANLDVLDIDEVLLVGGLSNTPKLASNIADLFPESTVIAAPSLDTKFKNPEELVARGAALQASLLESFSAEEIAESLQPVILNTQHISKAIGLVDAAGQFVTVLKSETTYPIKKSLKLAAPKGQDILITVVEGEHSIKETVIEPTPVSDDEDDEYSDEEPEVVREKIYVPGSKLAELALRDNQSEEVEVTFSINKDGVLSVTAREVKPGCVAFKGEIQHN